MAAEALRNSVRELCRKCSVVRLFDPWGSSLCTCPLKYSLHPYTGCSHLCLYCYATSYIGVRPSTPKKNFIRRLKRDLRYVLPVLPIDMSTSSDPYPPEEERYRLTRQALEILVPRGYRILITTKGALVSRDKDILASGNVAVMLTITTLNRDLALRLEPGAPPPEKRLEALKELSEAGVPVGIRLDPIIPGLNHDPGEIKALLREAVEAGARFVVTSTYKAKPDNLVRMKAGFPEIKEMLENLYRRRGIWMHGYWYLPENMRRMLLKPVVEEARRLGIGYATCREGFTDPGFFNAGSCDGTHLIPRRMEAGTYWKA